ncbi:MAG: hypothetical protein EXR03_03315 [Pseudolabrys sp.]|nr:hypothetical protein [Pseudolabrys sp.]MSP31838.1 hypothetical protein [Pseudolabrys sp.]
MRRIQRIVMVATLVALAPILAGCAGFDPEQLDIFGLSEKKKLPGDRKPLFPEGVPGVSQGIPPEYVKGNQPPPETASAEQALPAEPTKQTAAVDPADEPKPKPKRKPTVAKQKLIPDQSPRPAQGQQPQPWPTQNQQQPPQQSSTAPWPSSPTPGTFSR